MPLLIPLCIVGCRHDNNNNTVACPLAAVRSWNSSEKCQMPDVRCQMPDVGCQMLDVARHTIMTCWTAAQSGFVVLSANEPLEAFGKDSRPKHVHQEIFVQPAITSTTCPLLDWLDALVLKHHLSFGPQFDLKYLLLKVS